MTREIPEISIIAPARRPSHWMNVYNNIGHNDVTFEMIFVGPNEPNFELPHNFIFIKTNVKPAQCYEIAARKARGNLLLNFGDDIFFNIKSPLDKLYNEYRTYNDEKIIMSSIDHYPAYHHYFQSDPSSPILASASLISRKLYMNIGGIDRNFIAVYGESDVVMRIYALGGRVILSKAVYIEERHEGEHLCGVFPDRQYLDSLWVVNGRAQFNRAKPVEPFSDDRILEESQGPKGKWV